MSNYNKTYHKGEFRSDEWTKHLRPFLKRIGNKRWRKTGKNIQDEEVETLQVKRLNKIPKTIKVRITKAHFKGTKLTFTNKYRTLRDAMNAMNQGNILRAEIVTPNNLAFKQ